MQLLSCAQRNITEQNRFSYRPFKLEVCSGGRPALARRYPFLIVSLRSWKRLRRLLEVFHLVLGNQFGVLSIKSTQNSSAITDEQQTFILLAHLASIF